MMFCMSEFPQWEHVDSDDEDTLEQSTLFERTTGGLPAVVKEVEAEAWDVGGRQVKEQMLIRRAEHF